MTICRKVSMKNAVIYARYSSDKQNEMSIEGQIEECQRYAASNDLLIVQEYIDRAQSAKTDRRPEFLRMIADSEFGNFEVILVYQLDRFARNKNDSGYYKKILADNGVRVISAKENIASDSSGIITEGMLETISQWFSAQLSEKVTRGMLQRAAQCKYNGSTVPLGYAVDENDHFILDEQRAPIVLEIYERVASGETIKSVMDDLNDRGIKTQLGNQFKRGSLSTVLHNEMYKGIYIYKDVRIPGGVPRIISDELFEEVQEITRKRKHGHRPAIEDYLLSGKLFCGHCKDPMDGVSGTSSTGKTYRYYKCLNSPKKCNKKNVRKDVIEPLVLDACRDLISEEMIDNIIKAVEEQNHMDQESPTTISLREKIKSIESKIEVLLDQLEEGVNSARIVNRLKQREDELEELNRLLQKEQAKQRIIEPDLIRIFMRSIKLGSRDDLEYQKLLVNTLIDRIYLYDDHFSIFLNHSGRKGKVSNHEVADIEKYFNNNPSSSSITLDSGTPTKNGRLQACHFLLMLSEG